MLDLAYRLLTDLAAPVIRLYLLKRRIAGREDKERFRERLGIASVPRPEGCLIWCHAASVGEAASLLAVVDEVRNAESAATILITTGTVTSARLLDGRLPPRVIHQYVPVDRALYARRFLEHWQPDLVLWIESELWPNLLTELRRMRVPALLLNGRMSEKSFRNWQRAPAWARAILSAFDLCLTQGENERERFLALGAGRVRTIGNIKYAAKPLPCNEKHLAALKAARGLRPCWLIASTHPGEEKIACRAHEKLAEKFPGLLTIVAPRHAARGDEVAQFIKKSGFVCARRSKGEAIGPDTQIYLADTMGELGLFYRLAPIAAIGGSFADIGGHNPIEPAQLGAAIVLGPHMRNFSDVAEEFLARHAALEARSGEELAARIGELLADAALRETIADAAKDLADEKRHVMERVMAALRPWLGFMKSAA